MTSSDSSGPARRKAYACDWGLLRLRSKKPTADAGPRKCLQIDFWSNLKELVDETEKPQWMTVQYLAKLLGQDMQQDRIEANEVDTKSAKLKGIFARQRFIPVVSSTEVEAVTDQYGSALNVARSVLSR
jgi:hypothetical protein